MIKKQYPTATVLSLSTGVLLCEFGEMHELSEWLLGHSVWTHEFADKSLWEKMRGMLVAQHPALEHVNADGIGKDNWKPFLAEQVAALGETLPITCGDENRTESPIESLQRIAPGKPVIEVQV